MTNPLNTPFPHVRNGLKSLSGRAFMGALGVFDLWMEAPAHWRDKISLLGLILTVLATLMAFVGLFVLALKGIWAGAYPFLKQLNLLSWDVAFLICVLISGLLLCSFGKLFMRVFNTELNWLNPDYHRDWLNQAADPLLIQRTRKFEGALLTCSPLEQRIANFLWQGERVARAKANILSSRLPPAQEVKEQAKRKRL